MIVKKHILKTITTLESHYNVAPVAEATFYSKLAIIELCGWIEYSMDYVVQTFANRKLKTTPYKDIFKSVKENNFGFEYKKHFRKMLYQTIGLYNMEKIERKLDRAGQITVLHSELDNLKTLRDDAAHTYIDATKVYQAPSVTKAQFLRIYPILKDIDREVRSIK